MFRFKYIFAPVPKHKLRASPMLTARADLGRRQLLCNGLRLCEN